jgi:Zn-dependent peptidase ImmA (M78 family)/transcriptional regulator with XRE-family HTH domain
MGSFVGERLRDARVARSLTAVAVAELVGVTPAALSMFENGAAEPKPGTLTKIAGALQLSESYFLRANLESGSQSPCFFRSLTSTTKRARESARVRLGWVREVRNFLLAYLELPSVNVPDLTSTASPQSLGFDDLETLAHRLREIWGMGDGPIENVAAFLESKGICLARFALGAEDLDGFSRFIDGEPYIVLNTEKRSAVRSRFDAAHELAHLVLHRNVPPSSVSRTDLHKLMEAQAHRFAGAFLFPAKAFADEVYSLSLDSLISVKKTWRISIQAIIRRALDLQFVSERQYERACVMVSRNGYRVREPLDDEIPEENPTVLRRGLELLVEQGGLTRADILYRLPFSAPDIEILTQLPRGYLSGESMGELVPLKPRSLPSGPPTGRGDVLPFRSGSGK